MGYHPETMVCSFPPHPKRWPKVGERPRWSFARALYALKPWIGFDVWHIDPEKPGTGNRTDDSCGWFDRTPGDYADAVAYVLKDETFMHDVRLAIARREPMPYPFYEGISERHMTGMRLPAGEALALVLMVASELELRRWWNGQRGKEGAASSWWRKTFTRKRVVSDEAVSLALHPLDNLSQVDTPESMVRLIAAALNRRFRPRWKHPRWHVHHWKINFDLTRNLRRMFEPCATCRKPLGFAYCPHVDHRGPHHSECLGIRMAAEPVPGSDSGHSG